VKIANDVILSAAKDLAPNAQAALAVGKWLRNSTADASQAQHDSCADERECANWQPGNWQLKTDNS
jgi:hypothetical protein